MHTGPKTPKTSPSNREKSVWWCFAALTSPGQNLVLCIHGQEQKNPLSARSNLFPEWGQSVEIFLRAAHKLCVCPETETCTDGSYLGLEALLGGRQPESALPRLTFEVPRSQGTSHLMWKCQATRSPLCIFWFHIWVTRQFRVQILSEAMHNMSSSSKKKHASWAYFQYFEDVLILQWSKNRSGLIKIVQFHSCTDQLIYVLVSLWFLFLNSWFIWARQRSKNYFESSVMRKLTTN